MIETLTRNAFRILIGLCAALALIGLFFRAEYGAEAFPLMYPLVALATVPTLVLAVRALSRLLETESGLDSERDAGDDHAD
jgi:hypothetical protein